MGAWASGPFENDDAADWRYLLLDGGGPEVVADALRAVVAAGGTGVTAASNAVAAAAVVGAGLGVADPQVPDDVAEWLAAVDAGAWRPLAPEAVRALDRVLTESELRDLWDEADDSSWSGETRA